MKIKLSDIKPSPRAIRKTWSEEGLEELAQSIKEHGLIVPIKVRPTNGKFELVYGHRRVKAMRRAGLQEAEAFVEAVNDTEVLVQALIENVQREEMFPIDIAKALFAVQEETGWSQKDMARRGIMGESSIQHYMALLTESPQIQKMIVRGADVVGAPKGTVTEHHIRLVRQSGLPQSDREAVIKKAAKEGLTADQTRRVAETVKAAPGEQAKKKVLQWEYSPVLHDPERVKARADQYGAHDTLYRERTPKADKGWRDAPEVKAIIDSIRQVHNSFLPDWQKSTQKMSPEARKFVGRLVRNLATDLKTWSDKLER
ncbi:MAG: ParB/RepB/Spo0J family partition protein [Anaerolineales bacterium]|jgi:ParB family chromosome partitioning protein